MAAATQSQHWNEAFSRLLVAKEMYEHGCEHARRSGALNKMVAVHDLHNAVEVALRATLFNAGVELKGRSDKFRDLLSEVDKLCIQNGGTLSLKHEMETLNDVRNLVQHQVYEPSGAGRWVTTVGQFLTLLLSDLFDQDFDDISPIDLVEDDNLRALLAEANNALQAEDVARSITGSSLAFDATVETIFGTSDDDTDSTHLMGSILYGSGLLDFLESNGMSEDDRSVLEMGFRDLTRRTVRAEHLAGLLASGVSYEDYKQYTDTINETPGELFDNDAKWIYHFVLNAIITWQTNGLLVYIAPIFSKAVQDYISASPSS